jgi:dTDP-4-amino-4,6-dideoxygalactose transaminase
MQLIDLKAQYAYLKPEITSAMQEVLDDCQFILGGHVERLEHEIGKYIGVKNVISCANGTDALQLLYMAYNIGAADAVFCPDITFIASIESAAMLGAVPVFCDVTEGTYNICPQSLERQIKAVFDEGKLRPRAVVAVDFLGNPADYPAILDICKKYNLILIEDAAQSFGASFMGKMCGSFGDASIASFFPAKPLGCFGDGGAVLTGDDNIADLCRSLRVHGKGTNKYDNVRIGINSRLDTIQAAILLVKLKALREFEMDRRQNIAKRYDMAFYNKFELIKIPVGCISTYAQYVLLAESKSARDRIISSLTSKDMPSSVYYPIPMHAQEVFSKVRKYQEEFYVANDYCRRTFSLPMHPYLNENDQDYIISAVLEALND